MKFLKELFNTNRIELIKENETIRRKKKDLEKEFDDYKEEVDTLKDKYITLLEEKAKGFDLYIHYEEEAKKQADKVRELKKELAEANEQINKKKTKC